MSQSARWIWGLGALLSVGIAIYALHYLLPNAGGPVAVLANPFVRPWLYIHVGCGGAALLIAPFQLWPRLRARQPQLHRWMGRAYVAAALVGGVAGFLMALGSTAGPVASVGFGALAVLWFGTTAQAWRMARARRFVEHRRWMIRSFALIFAAVTLRLYLPVVAVLGLDFPTSYRAISFLCWVPNLIVAEFYLARRRTAPIPVAAA
jgi:hypothetical protein